MKWKVSKSDIHGNGVFAKEDINEGDDIGVSIPLKQETRGSKIFERNTFGLLINESKEPNAACKKIGDDWHFVALQPIKKDEEIFVDYSDYENKVDWEAVTSGKRVSVI